MVDMLRDHPPAVAWLRSLGEEEIVLPAYVLMELLQRAAATSASGIAWSGD